MLGFGAMRLPTDKNGVIDDALNKKMVQRAIDAGINYFDTAYMYMGGKSEKAMGRAAYEFKNAKETLKKEAQELTENAQKAAESEARNEQTESQTEVS